MSMKHSIAKLVGWTLTLWLGLVAGERSAQAQQCANDSQHDCWRDFTTVNYGQLAVGKAKDGIGIVCAVTSPQSAEWGGRIHCFRPVARSGASLNGRGGEEAQPPSSGGPFVGTDPNKRIVSLAIETGPSAGTVVIHTLRSDRSGPIRQSSFIKTRSRLPPA
jgi:hypothetical protein